MLTIFLDILAFLLTVFILVVLHEYGHFLTARWLGVKVRRFSIGFGRPIWRRVSSKSNIEYRIGYLPLGGYVQLLDEREQQVSPELAKWAFNRQKAWKRLAIVIAGPVMNLVLAVAAYALMFIIGLKVIKPVIGDVEQGSIAARAGLKPDRVITRVDGYRTSGWQDVALRLIFRLGDRDTMRMQTQPMNGAASKTAHKLDLKNWRVDELRPDPIKALGFEPYRPPAKALVEHIESGSPADKAGIQKGDQVISLNGQPVKDWYGLIKSIRELGGKTTRLTVSRDGRKKSVEVKVEKKSSLGAKTRGYLGVGRSRPQYPDSMKAIEQYMPHVSLWAGMKKTASMLWFNYVVIAKLVTGDLAVASLGGPISIFQASASAFEKGIPVYLNFLGLISVMLAVLNTLPIPGLDGGHLLMLVIEKIIRRPVPLRVELLIYRLGFIALILILFHATVNDLMRIFSHG